MPAGGVVALGECNLDQQVSTDQGQVRDLQSHLQVNRLVREHGSVVHFVTLCYW
jgi:hypothetical protein